MKPSASLGYLRRLDFVHEGLHVFAQPVLAAPAFEGDMMTLHVLMMTTSAR